MDFNQHLADLAARGLAGVVDLVDAIIREGIRRGASDIHLEPGGEGLSVRFRLDGVLHPATAVPTPVPQNVVARVKVLAELLTYQTDKPQEGRINRAKVDAPGDLRVSTFPTVHGEKAVIRLFDRAVADVRLDGLGYPDGVRAELERHLQMPRGVILLTGPAGSGKTTTIYAALRFILEKTGGARNIVTVEDPVERIIPGVTQTQVHAGTGLTFARCLRSLMRQDPEVIVVGEVRDSETAEIATEAGLTGHLVISTIHSGSAPGVFTRLLEMGIPPYLITSSVSFVAAQRLVRKLCPSCKRPLSQSDDLLGLPPDLLGSAFEGAGCDQCFGTGYVGRIVLVESLRMTDPLREEIIARASAESLQSAAESAGMHTLRQSGLAALKAGATSPSELRRILGPEG